MPDSRGETTVSVVMPAYNEAQYLDAAVREVVAGLRGANLHAEVVIVENGSADATARVARQLSNELDDVRAISLERADYGEALRTGLLEARGEIVVHFDVDYYDLEFLHRAVDLISGDGASVVVASKRAPGSADRRPLGRRVITAVFTQVLRRGFGLAVSDTHGMKALHRRAVLPLVERCRVGGELFDTEVVLRAERAGLAVTEVPVAIEESRPPRTSIVRRGVKATAGLLHLRLVLWRGR